MKKRIASILMIMVMMVTGSVFGVFATGEQQTGQEPAVAPAVETPEQAAARQAAEEAAKQQAIQDEAASIEPIQFVFTVKQNKTLRSHKGKKATYKLRKGDTLIVSRFSGGQYVFDHNGSTFYVNKTRLRYKKTIWAKNKKTSLGKKTYSKAAVEAFINKKKISSPTKHMVFVSTFTQRAYHLKGSKGNWKVVKVWKCGTGKAISPTPTGVNGVKAIWKKVRTRRGLPYWSAFSSMNCFHGKRSSWKVGFPASGGCIRNTNGDAEYIFKTVPMKSRVYIF